MATTKLKKDEYIQTIGRRKTATASVRLYEAGRNDIQVNEKKVADYFPTEEMHKIALSPFEKLDGGKFKVTVKVSGGGIHAQAEAVRHGIARALVAYEPEIRGELKREGYLKRDPRTVERKKFGLRKARKKEQWKKR